VSFAISWITSQRTLEVATTIGLSLFEAVVEVCEAGVAALGDEWVVCWVAPQAVNPSASAKVAAFPMKRVLKE
jgi:hypothetical protein